MPELPDVAIFKRYLDSTALHKEITGVVVRDAAVLANVSAVRLRKRLTGRSFESTSRHGKYLFAALAGDVLVLHFGMTGHLAYFRSEADEPEYTRVLCSFENGYHLAYVSPRKLGEVRVVRDVTAFLRAKDIGPDAMDLDAETFREILSDRRGLVKSALMDQSLIAGIGNIYSDEALFQARLHPRTRVQDLHGETIKRLFDRIHEVLDTAIDVAADPGRLPDRFLTPHRHEGGRCPGCGGKVQRIRISGRSAYLCPSCQKRP